MSQKLVSKNSKNDYNLIRQEAEKPAKERQKIIETKSGTKKAKNYALQTDEANQRIRIFKDKGIFLNPYKEGGVYHAFVQSLINLGINKKHPFHKVKRQIRYILSSYAVGEYDAWKVFERRKNGNEYTACDINGRIIETGRMLQRINGFNPYGEKLRQMLSCVNVYRDRDGLPVYELRTGFSSYDDVEPTRERKKRR